MILVSVINTRNSQLSVFAQKSIPCNSTCTLLILNGIIGIQVWDFTQQKQSIYPAPFLSHIIVYGSLTGCSILVSTDTSLKTINQAWAFSQINKTIFGVTKNDSLTLSETAHTWFWLWVGRWTYKERAVHSNLCRNSHPVRSRRGIWCFFHSEIAVKLLRVLIDIPY